MRKTLKQSGQQTTESSDRLCYYCKFFLATCASQLVVNNFLGRKMHIAEYNKRKKKATLLAFQDKQIWIQAEHQSVETLIRE